MRQKLTLRKQKEAHKAMYMNSTEENNNRFKGMKSKAKKAVSKAMKRLKKRLLNKNIVHMGCFI